MAENNDDKPKPRAGYRDCDARCFSLAAGVPHTIVFDQTRKRRCNAAFPIFVFRVAEGIQESKRSV
jgi:hypothetical protein